MAWAIVSRTANMPEEYPGPHPDIPDWPDWSQRRSRPRYPLPHTLRERPTWWPENEPWPPRRERLHYNPFFRRLGCFFGLFNLFAISLVVIAGLLLAHLFGLIRLAPYTVEWTIPVGWTAVILIVIGLVLVASAMRRVFNPLDNLLQATDRLAEGDYSAYVPERGPRATRSMIRAFNKMAARLHEVDAQRRALLADVTHELRTPLTVIQGNLEGMLDGVYPADEANLRALLDETHLLSRLIEDLRTLALAESGALQLKKEPTDLPLLLRETSASFRAQADAAGVTLTVEAGALPLIDLDPGRMRQVFSNLFSNALRYAAQNNATGGSVVVHAKVEAEQAIVEVRDSGPGIPPEDLPRIFERFYKSSDSGGRVPQDSGGKVPQDSGGMGLGLSIARHLVQAHGGTIEAQSAPGEGTTIRVALPISL